MEILSLSHATHQVNATIPLASSKSESNRALIIQALSGNKIQLTNLAEARDTQTMIRLLASQDTTLDVLDAGTTMRFLTAFCTVTNRKVVLTGTERMQQRPISILVDALRSLGAEIEYVKNEGFPPLNIKGFTQKNKAVTVAGDVSSQYISALLMVAPTLPQGLELTLAGEVASRPYIEMTLDLMKHFGVTALWEGNQISVAPQNYQPSTYSIESDWSGASYWFSVVALAEKAELTLLGLRKNSLQGDSVIVKIMDSLGVSTEITEGGLRLSKKESVKYFEFNFADCPDLAQTVSVVCAAKGIKAKLYGLKSLRIKETDRIAAIEKELGKFGAKITVEGDDAIYIETSHLDFSLAKVHTYEDHRMAMAFAPLALLHPIEIEDPSVVNKSYPSFWKHLALAGFSCDVK